MSEQIEIKCPICKKGIIKILHREKQISVRKSACRAGGKNTVISNAHDNVLSQKCPNCGKTRLEIQRRLTEGKIISAKEAAKRAQESGLPLKF